MNEYVNNEKYSKRLESTNYTWLCVCVCWGGEVKLLLQSINLQLYIFVLNKIVCTFVHFYTILSFE